MFTTEGHVLPIDKTFRKKPWQETDGLFHQEEKSRRKIYDDKSNPVITKNAQLHNNSNVSTKKKENDC